MPIIGNGGHARSLAGWVSDKPTVVGFAGKTCKDLRARYEQYKDRELEYICHHSVRGADDGSILIGDGAQIFPGVIINSGASIGQLAIINTGAIIEHGAIIGVGSHIAPGAIVLGDAVIGECCYVGAGAVVIQGVKMPDETFVKALTVYNPTSS